METAKHTALSGQLKNKSKHGTSKSCLKKVPTRHKEHASSDSQKKLTHHQNTQDNTLDIDSFLERHRRECAEREATAELWKRQAKKDLDVRVQVYNLFSDLFDQCNDKQITIKEGTVRMQELDFYFVHTNFYKIYIMNNLKNSVEKHNVKSASMKMALEEWVGDNYYKGLPSLFVSAPKSLHGKINKTFIEYEKRQEEDKNKMYLHHKSGYCYE
jgi:hypothetical protein